MKKKIKMRNAGGEMKSEEQQPWSMDFEWPTLASSIDRERPYIQWKTSK